MKKHFILSFLMFLIAGVAKTPVAISVEETKPLEETTEIEPIVSAESSLTVINPGKEPRQELRFTPIPLSQQTTTMTTNIDLDLLINGQAIPKMNTPITETKMAVEVTQVTDNGDIVVNFAYTDAQVLADSNSNPALVEAMTSQIKDLVNLTGEYTIDNRGNTKDINIQIPEESENKELLEQTLQSVAQVSSILPTEAVGIGAEWIVSQPLTVNGIDLNQVTTYKLVNLENNLATLEANISQTADQQSINPLPQAPDTSVDLLSLQGNGQGTITVQLDKIMPITGTMELVSQTIMSMNNDSNQPTLLESKSSMKIDIQSQPINK